MPIVVLSTLLTLAGLSAVIDTGRGGVPGDLCASRKPGASVEAFVVSPPVRARDTVVTASICVLPPKSSTTKVGSYHGELYFDSTAARVLRVEKPRSGEAGAGGGGGGGGGGLRVENTSLAGRVNFAGAAPSGFAPGALLNVLLRVKRPGAQLKLRLKMLELNATDGSSLMSRLVVTPIP
jgi:hypothetical protein